MSYQKSLSYWGYENFFQFFFSLYSYIRNMKLHNCFCEGVNCFVGFLLLLTNCPTLPINCPPSSPMLWQVTKPYVVEAKFQKPSYPKVMWHCILLFLLTITWNGMNPIFLYFNSNLICILSLISNCLHHSYFAPNF